jgi:hypothetical protein
MGLRQRFIDRFDLKHARVTHACEDDTMKQQHRTKTILDIVIVVGRVLVPVTWA